MRISKYKKDLAVEYAKVWAKRRNPKYYNFDGLGGDCTNFISQCLYAGSGVMNFTKTFGWYYKSLNFRTPSWTSVEYLYNFLISRDRIGPFASVVKDSQAEIGDIVQLAHATGDYFHTAIITEKTNNNILVSCHSRDLLNVPLSIFRYDIIRFMHVEGVYVN